MRSCSFRYPFLIMLIGLCLVPGVRAQEQDLDNYRMRFNLRTVKHPDMTRTLEVRFIAANKKDRKDRVPVYGATIAFYNFLEDEAIPLGTANSSKEGVAEIVLPKEQVYLTDSEGFINFRAVFEGTEGMDGEMEEIRTKDVLLDLRLIEKDSLRTVQVNAHTMDSLEVQIPVDGADLIISVEGMLSKMIIDEGRIENGTYELKMPTDLPGDARGNITIIASIEDHDDFGDVVQKETQRWGVLNEVHQDNGNRLWSEAAPMWMYVVLTVLLVGIWANFVYTGIHLLKIKKEGEQFAKETKDRAEGFSKP